MQALRHASRRAFHAPVVQKHFGASAIAYSSEAASTASARKSKEERSEVARQFIAKFKAANNGQLPGISLLRKEVGGKYEVLKEVLEGVSKAQGKPDVPKEAGKSKDAEKKTQDLVAGLKKGLKKQSPVDGDLLKEQKGTWQVSKSSKAEKTADPAKSSTISKDTESVMPVEDGSKHTGLLTEDDDDDSDVTAPEYQSSSAQIGHQKVKEFIKAAKVKEKVLESGPRTQVKRDSKKQNDGQAIKLKFADMKQPEMDIKQPGVKSGGIIIESPHKAWDTDDTAAKHLFADGSKPFIPRPSTTVARIVNLPHHMTASKLKALCETVASVHDVDLRRGFIADVHFNVEVHQMADIITRMKSLSTGTNTMRVFPAARLSCRNKAKGLFKPHDVYQYRNLRNILFLSLDQRLKFLQWQLEDFRELQGFKPAI